MGKRAQPASNVEYSLETVPRFTREGRSGRRQVSTALMSWATHTLQWRKTTGCKYASASESLKFRLSSDWGLQPDPMKSESVVIADQHAAVNTFSGLVHTARQGSKVGGYQTSYFTGEIEFGDEA